MATLRNAAISLLRLAGATNIAAQLRHYATHTARPINLVLSSRNATLLEPEARARFSHSARRASVDDRSQSDAATGKKRSVAAAPSGSAFGLKTPCIYARGPKILFSYLS